VFAKLRRGKIVFENVLLEQEQKDLLLTFVEAARNVPRDKRREFRVIKTSPKPVVSHPGLIVRISVHMGDIAMLAAEELINLSDVSSSLARFDVTPRGFAYYEWMKQRVGQPIQNEEEMKLNEKALLLVRFYLRDEIYKIGKEMRLPYFDQFENYWDMEHYQGALEISRAIADENLLKLTEESPPRYGRNLGGFQGKYYTAAEKGEVKLASSWEDVRKHVQKVLGKWGEKGYGVLQAIINKGGRASYFEIIDEIEKVLGYEYVPSYLLPRFSPLKLVFKTGSSRYPDWTMPTEIVPVVREELIAYKESSGKIDKVSIEEEVSLSPDYGSSADLDRLHNVSMHTRRTVFISYASKDRDFVERLAADLRNSGARVWFDQWEIKVGDSITQKINEGIRDNDYLAVVLSPDSVASHWVRKELNAAMMKELNSRSVVVLPILYSDCTIPSLIADKRYADFRTDYKAGLSEIVGVLAPKGEMSALAKVEKPEKLPRKIPFDYAPDSPENHRWVLVLDDPDGPRKERPAFELVSDYQGSPALRIEPKERYYIDYQIEGEARLACKSVEFIAELEKDSALYAQLNVQRKGRSTPKAPWTVWLMFKVGTGAPYLHSKRPHECIVPVSPMPLGEGWSSLRVSLPNQVENTPFGEDGWEFAELVSLRVRGNISLSSITLYGS
jgi:hypothetical protein